jgi:hypothetical protein
LSYSRSLPYPRGEGFTKVMGAIVDLCLSWSRSARFCHSHKKPLEHTRLTGTWLWVNFLQHKADRAASISHLGVPRQRGREQGRHMAKHGRLPMPLPGCQPITSSPISLCKITHMAVCNFRRPRMLSPDLGVGKRSPYLVTSSWHKQGIVQKGSTGATTLSKRSAGTGLVRLFHLQGTERTLSGTSSVA